jgi:hypothetical protein
MICPICGEKDITIIGETIDGRAIGSCKDAFPKRYLKVRK